MVTLVLVAAGIGWGIYKAQSNPARAEVGDCINYASESDVSVVDCASEKAQYRVEQKNEGVNFSGICDDVADSDISIYSKDSGSKAFLLCVSLVVKDGTCLSEDGDLINCTDPGSSLRVTAVHAGATDDAVCGEAEYARVYAGEPRVVCLTDAS